MDPSVRDPRKQRIVALLVELVDILTSTEPTPTDEPAPTARLLTSSEVCDLLGCSSPTLHKHVKAGRIPALRVGDVLRFDRAAVLAAMAKTSVDEAPVRLTRRAG